MSTLLTLSDVGYRIGKKMILHDIDMSVQSKEIVTIVGPNGAGKTTLLSLALQLMTTNIGRVVHHHVNGQPLRIGYVPQLINRDPTMPISVSEFIALSRQKPSKKSIQACLSQFNLLHLQSAFISELSGGEMRRVLFARAILCQPQLLVLDEPMAGVDIAGQEVFYHQLSDLREQYGFAILMVSHDLHLVMSATDRVICLNRHICCQGKPSQVIDNPHYQALFADESTNDGACLAELGVYRHRHDHSHEH